MARLFIALELPENIKNELSLALKTLKKLKLVEGSFVRPENLHLTLKFLDHQPEENKEIIIEKLKKIIMPCFDLELGVMGYFADNNYIKVIWASVLSKQLLALRDSIEDITQTFRPTEEREFNPHITLLRIKKLHRQCYFLESLKHIRLKPLVFEASYFTLMESVSDIAGLSYKELARFELVA